MSFMHTQNFEKLSSKKFKEFLILDFRRVLNKVNFL